MGGPLHHIELWTHDLAEAEPAWDWLLTRLGWVAAHDPAWVQGRTWRAADDSYLVLEQSTALRPGGHDRLRTGLNHLAFRAGTHADLDLLRADADAHGWRELFAEQYPHAGGPRHVALFLENTQGFEVELVARTATREEG